MRVVAGSLRGRALLAPPGRGTRPTSDRVREAMLSSVVSHAGLEGARVADLFAGSGALGIEALSRGAASAVFVERDRGAAEALAANLARLGLAGPGALVRRGDALAAAGSAEVASADVVFADPPYAFTAWPDLLGRLRGAGTGALVVAESGSGLLVPAGWETVRARAYGSTVVTMMRPGREVEA